MNIRLIKFCGQQGDLMLRRLDKMPKGEQKLISKGRCVLAHGESGHSHVIEQDDAELIAIGERMILTLPTEAAPLKHGEHGEETYAPGIWEIGHVREKDWFQDMVRKVQD